MCRLCENERETFHHFLTECPRLLSDRAEIFKDYSGPDLNGSTWTVNDIMKFSWTDTVEEAYNAFMYQYQEGDDGVDMM